MISAACARVFPANLAKAISAVLVRAIASAISLASAILFHVSPVPAQEFALDSLPAASEFESVAKILEQRCLQCHNDTDRQGDFSVQSRSSLFDSSYIEVGRPQDSHLLSVVSSQDGPASMPKDAEPLSEDQINQIRQWIQHGASWPAGVELNEPAVDDFAWWSYQPLAAVDVPELDSDWVVNPIDAFVLDMQKQRTLQHAPPAGRRALIRRLYYDLIGLPPSYAEVQRFVKDTSPKAYERLVDHLLDSPHYGERWARHWLDVVKYADTHGYDKDKLRPNAWPYRDYVIRSFNEDKSYARFVQEQIAGDVLFPGEPDGILGLGFLAAGPWDFIGHVEVPESKIDGKVARNLDRDDLVSNTVNTFCSLTIQCARCHNHKFDPITQEDYYGFQSIFSALDRCERVYETLPEVEEQRSSLTSELVATESALQQVVGQIDPAAKAAMEKLRERIAVKTKEVDVRKTPAFGFHSQIASSPNTPKSVLLELAKKSSVAEIVIHPCHDDFNQIGAGFCFPLRFKIEVSAEGKHWTTVANETEKDFPNPLLQAYHAPGSDVPIRFLRFTATKLAERQGDYALALAEIEVLLPSSPEAAESNLAKVSRIKVTDSIEAPVRWSTANLTDGEFPQYFDGQIAAELASAQKELSQIREQIYTPRIEAKLNDLKERIAQLKSALQELPSGKKTFAVGTHFAAQGNFQPTLGKPRSIHVLHRGDVQQPKQVAAPGFIPLQQNHKNILAPDSTEAQRRAELARWLTSKDNPLTWRSIVNRVWLYHFGRGLVDTPNDFGRMGATPTHPQLLDWLAVEFRDGRYTMKELHRLIVTSNTYQQSSQFDSTNAAVDAENRYLWRMGRRRLEAEEIRDSILFHSGALDLQMGGPGFYLFELEKTEHSPHYEYYKFDPGDRKSHRRSIYRFVVRSQPNPWMTTLDCADSSQSTPQRSETLTALQALTLLNNRFNLAMAEYFAKDVQSQDHSLPAQVREAFQRVTQRSPNPSELQRMVSYAENHGLTNLCRFLFNLSEFSYLD